MSTHDWNPNFVDLSPMFEPFLHLKEYFANCVFWPEHTHLNKLALLQNQQILTQSEKKICFVPQGIGRQCFEQNYESRIYLTGQIQTRAKNWHDFFNALVWHTFPRAKSALNQLHYQAQLFESANKIKHRCALRDAATLFDESGVIVVSSEKTLIQLLSDFEWKELFWRQRKGTLSSMQFFVFGHGLYEKALNPYVGMTGKGIIFNVKEAFFTQTLLKQLHLIDSILESFLLQVLSSSSDLTPVPLLGYPGWVEDNNSEIYYENKKYFRDRHKSD
ncbi:MAG: DUF3025 domain-containing protein [Nitrosomonas sp.]|nr:DUF3025 domain-containing protein [Nitrosomonas sp.]